MIKPLTLLASLAFAYAWWWLLNAPDPGMDAAVERAKRLPVSRYEEMARQGRWPC